MYVRSTPTMGAYVYLRDTPTMGAADTYRHIPVWYIRKCPSDTFNIALFPSRILAVVLCLPMFHQ